MKSSGTSLGKTFGKLFALSAAVIAAAGIKDFLSGAIDEAREAQKVGAQTGAVLKSTGAIANVSAGQVDRLAGALSEKIGVDDEAIQAGENMLLTFTKVRNEVGKGNDIFNQATRLVQDMAAAFGGDAVTQSKALGKALNDPVKGVTALTRVGVQFTDAQKEQIKTLVESGDILGAQKIILKELATQTKGSAEAQVTNADKARVAYANLQEQVGTALLPVLDKLAGLFTDKIAPAISEFVTQMQDGTGAGGQFRDVMEGLWGSAKSVAQFFTGLPGVVKSFGGEALIAAAILPKLTGVINGLGGAVGLTTGKLTGLRKGLVLAAGVGGMVALTEGAKTGNKQVGLLGAALTGAFVGGTLGSAIPGVGTAVGAVGGFAAGAAVGMWKLKKAADAAGGSAEEAKPDLSGLAESLNQVSGAATRATKALILQKLQEDGIITAAGQLGIVTSDLIKSSLGNKQAIERVNTAWERQGNLLDGVTNQKVSEWLGSLRGGLSKSQQAILDANAALDGTDRKSRKAANALKAVGRDRPATNKWQALFQGDLDQAGATAKGFSRSTRRLLGAEVGKARANMQPFTNDLISQLKGGVGKSTHAGKDAADKGTRSILDVIERQARKARADMPQLAPSVRKATDGAKAPAKSGGTGIGSAVKTGFGSGFAGAALAWSSALRAAVAAAIAAGRAEAKAHSPSKETEELGKDLGLGLVVGLEKSSDKVGEAAEKLTKKVKEKLANLRETLKGLKQDFASLVEPIKSAFTGDLFSAETAQSFVTGLMGTSSTLSKLKDAFAVLIKGGFNPKFLYDLFASGNAKLIMDLAANPALAAQASSLLGDVNQLSTELGQSVAGATPDGKAITAKIDKTNAKLDKLIDHVDRAADRTAEALTEPARNARRRAVRA